MLRKHLASLIKVRGCFPYCKHLVSSGGLSAAVCQKSRNLSCTHTVVDLRSDTLTKPTDRMREAMKNAVVGDDVCGEDPTVNKLQEVIADMLGKEAALLVPTCTMANTASEQLYIFFGNWESSSIPKEWDCCWSRWYPSRLKASVNTSTEPVHNLLCRIWETEEIPADERRISDEAVKLAGIQGCCVPNLPDGTIDLAKVEAKIRPMDDDHQPLTRAFCVENTHNRCGGKVLPLEYLRQVQLLGHKHNLNLHLDGARIFNAAVALRVPVADIAQYFDTVSVAFTKGLCCPIGSIIAGPKGFIDLARKARKALGGGMRQAGVIAAPMLVALEHMIPRLAEDHDRALRIATAVSSLQGNPVCSVDLSGVHSNIMMINIHGKVTPLQFSQRMRDVTGQEKKSLGQSISVLMWSYASTVRYVTHNDISDDDVDKVIAKFQYVIQELSSV